MPRTRIDYALGTAGLALAAAAVWFPWHVHLTPQDFGPPQMQLTRLDADLTTLAIPPMRPPEQRASLGPGIDRTVTGSVVKAAAEPASITVLFAATDRAILRLGQRLEMVAPGDDLGDDVRVVSITPDAVELSDGRRLAPTGPRK